VSRTTCFDDAFLFVRHRSITITTFRMSSPILHDAGATSLFVTNNFRPIRVGLFQFVLPGRDGQSWARPPFESCQAPLKEKCLKGKQTLRSSRFDAGSNPVPIKA